MLAKVAIGATVIAVGIGFMRPKVSVPSAQIARAGAGSQLVVGGYSVSGNQEEVATRDYILAGPSFYYPMGISFAGIDGDRASRLLKSYGNDWRRVQVEGARESSAAVETVVLVATSKAAEKAIQKFYSQTNRRQGPQPLVRISGQVFRPNVVHDGKSPVRLDLPGKTTYLVVTAITTVQEDTREKLNVSLLRARNQTSAQSETSTVKVAARGVTQ